MKISKIERVKRHLQKGRSITPRQAVAWFNYWRLSDCIFKLKKLRMKIDTETVRTKTSTFARYQLTK